jgi:hypothetical protein
VYASQEERLTVASLKRQYSQAFWVLLGPTALLNGALSAVIMPILCGTPREDAMAPELPFEA